MSRRFALLALALAAAPATRADVRLHPLFQDHMVLQRDTRVPIRGEADPGERVTVRGSWSPARADAVADEDGRWLAHLPTGPAGGPYSLTVEGATSTVRLSDVLLGDVWLCSGQSNMEMAFRWHAGVDDHERVLAAAYRPRIRLLDVARRHAAAPVREVEGTWAVCSPRSVEEFSAVAYCFARAVQERVPVPIGLIGASWGGTRCEAWTSREALEDFPELADGLALARRWAEEPERVAAEAEARRRAWWERLAEADGGAAPAEPEHDDSAWPAVELPGAWEETAVGRFDGVVWFRREVALPPGWHGAPLSVSLGPIDDMDTAWWNGVRIGGNEAPGEWATPRSYDVPAGVARAGRNVVAVRVVDTGGAGGFCGEPAAMSLRHGDPTIRLAFDLAGPWRFRRGPAASALEPFPAGEGFHPNRPTALFNGMIAPLAPFALKGVIWYQGESNRLEARLYRRLFPAMIRDWRRAFGRELPFFYVQIAPFAYAGDAGQAAALREAQLLALSTPGTGMACTMDVGDPDDVHPGDKRTVGRRLARWALARTYGVDVPCSGPLYRGYRVEDGALRVMFDHAGGLRTRDGRTPSHFVVAGADGVFHPAEAAIDGETVVVRSPEVQSPAAARYAWGAADEPNLENGAGLPASSFRTDDPDAEDAP